jgi:hypothetical protein
VYERIRFISEFSYIKAHTITSVRSMYRTLTEDIYKRSLERRTSLRMTNKDVKEEQTTKLLNRVRMRPLNLICAYQIRFKQKRKYAMTGLTPCIRSGV